jgi:arylsulfatase
MAMGLRIVSASVVVLALAIAPAAAQEMTGTPGAPNATTTSGIGRPGTGTLTVDGKVVSTQTMDRTVPLVLPWDETFDIGSKTGTPIDDQDYQVPFAFTGKIDKLTFSLEPPMLTEDDKKKLMEAQKAAQDAN